MRFCKHCGSPIDEGGFCSNCGALENGAVASQSEDFAPQAAGQTQPYSSPYGQSYQQNPYGQGQGQSYAQPQTYDQTPTWQGVGTNAYTNGQGSDAPQGLKSNVLYRLSLAILGILLALSGFLPWMNFTITNDNIKDITGFNAFVPEDAGIDASLSFIDFLDYDTLIDRFIDGIENNDLRKEFADQFKDNDVADQYEDTAARFLVWPFIGVWLIACLLFVINLIRVLMGKCSMRTPFIFTFIFAVLVISALLAFDAVLSSQVSDYFSGAIGPSIWLWIIAALSLLGAILSGKPKRIKQ